MPNQLNQIINELNDSSISYCHWKSNLYLDAALSGETDVDLLVRSSDKDAFQKIIFGYGFKEARSRSESTDTAVTHYFLLTPPNGKLIHFHIYYKVFTGGSILKNYRLPFQELLLSNIELKQNVKIPTKAADLVAFVIRKFLEYGNPLETFMLERESAAVTEEIHYLTENQEDIERSKELVAYYFPSIDITLFEACMESLKGNKSLIEKSRLHRRLSKSLRGYRSRGTIAAETSRTWRFGKKIFQKLFRIKTGGKAMVRGGSVIAIVGAEASGKSTIISEISLRLDPVFNVRYQHMGKPPHTLLTYIPSKIIPLTRKFLPGYRTSTLESKIHSDDNAASPVGLKLLIFSFRSLLVAWERYHAASTMNRDVEKGTIILCDRYPTQTTGAMDSSQIDYKELGGNTNILSRWFVKLENNIYRKIPAPEMIFKLSVPVETAVKRNAQRQKANPESTEFVRRRHLQFKKQKYTILNCWSINTDRPLDICLNDILTKIWRNL